MIMGEQSPDMVNKMNLEDIKELRKRTGVGILEAKNALEKHGNIPAAVEAIKKQIGEKNINPEVTSEGRVAVCIFEDRIGDTPRQTRTTMVELLCETDFTANTDEFLDLLRLLNTKSDEVAVDNFCKELSAKTGEEISMGRTWKSEVEDGEVAGAYNHNNRAAAVVILKGGTEKMAKDVAMHVVGAKPTWLSIEDIPIEEQVKISEETKKMMKGKPDHILEKIVTGKLQAFYKEKVLLEQPFIKDDKKSVKEWLGDAIVTKFNLIEAGIAVNTPFDKNKFEGTNPIFR